MDTLRALEILITSRTPLIAIETLEALLSVNDLPKEGMVREWARGRAVPA